MLTLEHFASGWKRHYYGKGDVIVYRLHRDGGPPMVESGLRRQRADARLRRRVLADLHQGDNTGLIATDSMKNFIQRETLNFAGSDLQGYCRFLGDKFLDTLPPGRRSASICDRDPIRKAGGSAFTPAGPDRAMARVEIATRKCHRGGLGCTRAQTAATGWQRVSWFRPRPVHDAAGHDEPAAAHVAGCRVAIHGLCRCLQRRRAGRYRPRAGSSRSSSRSRRAAFSR